MRKVVASLALSLDGVVENPHEWSFQYGSNEQQQYKFDELFSSDALLLGRVTYEGFAAVWPQMVEQTGIYGERMNTLPKYVASNTLQETTWNASLLKGSLADEISRRKRQAGQDILIFGSIELIRTLMQQDLIDEYRLMLFPIVLGKGKRLFNEGNEQKKLTLVSTQTFPSGVISLHYQLDRQ